MLDATLKLLGERGYARLAIEDVAAAAGVNKTTVYRRWPDKAELVVAALAARPRSEPKFLETGDLRADVRTVLESKARRLSSPSGRTMAHALMSVPADDAISSKLRAARFGVSSSLIQAAKDRGELPADVDPDLAAELLLAPIVNRIVVLGESASHRFIDGVVECWLRGMGYEPRRPAKKRQR